MTMTPGDYYRLRASDEDRRQVQSGLNDAFAEGRLTREELDQRTATLMTSVTYGDLARLTSDLPVGQAISLRPDNADVSAEIDQVKLSQAQRTNGMAIAALVCGILQVGFPLPTGLAAIILGHAARHRIRETGERGNGMALAGLILGYLGVIGSIIAIVAFLMLANGGLPAHMPAPPPPHLPPLPGQ
jgi:hypothetical protein